MSSAGTPQLRKRWRMLPERPPWHTCACCPPNLARLIASLGGYLWSEDSGTVYSHLLIGSEAAARFGRIRLETSYPWQGEGTYTVLDGGEFTLAIHIPRHAGSFVLSVNGRAETPALRDGYAHIRRSWQPGDTVSLRFDMPVRRVYADPRVRSCAGKTALARGPILYCLEETDQEKPLFSLSLPRGSAVRTVSSPPGLPPELVCLQAEGMSEKLPEALYSFSPPEKTPCTLTAIPYFAWANRGKGDMTVWIRED